MKIDFIDILMRLESIFMIVLKLIFQIIIYVWIKFDITLKLVIKLQDKIVLTKISLL